MPDYVCASSRNATLAHPRRHIGRSCAICKRQSAMTKQSYDEETARAYLAVEYPSCPEDQIPFLVQKLTAREWENAPLPKATGIVVTNHIRHTLTVYEALMKRYKLSRSQARLWVSDEVNAMTTAWREGAPIRALRRARKRRKHKPAPKAADHTREL